MKLGVYISHTKAMCLLQYLGPMSPFLLSYGPLLKFLCPEHNFFSNRGKCMLLDVYINQMKMLCHIQNFGPMDPFLHSYGPLFYLAMALY